MTPARTVVLEPHHAGPPTMGHGGYVAGLFTGVVDGAVQVTLRKPTPLGVPLTLAEAGGTWQLTADDELVADAVGATLELDVPPPPGVDEARAAEAGSPAMAGERGVHPTCFGCGQHTARDETLQIAVGPLEAGGVAQVAAAWTPADCFGRPDGTVDPQFVLAALDCPGAFAFIADGIRAGLLGRIVFEQYAAARVGDEHVVTGWQIERDGRKMFAGTALFTPDGQLLAAAKATWFGFPG